MSNILVHIRGIDQVSPVLAGITAKSNTMGGALGSALRKGSLVGGLAVVGLGAVAIKTFAGFDAAMTESLAIMGDVSATQRGEMSAAARQMAKETTFSAKQAAESYFFLASAGLNAEASVKALPVVAKFAQAGMFDMALATDLLTDAQSALGLTIRDDAVANMKNMVKVSDVLVKANTLANATVEQFSTALTTEAGAALKSFNIDMEEGVAVLAAFADQGVKGEVAGSGLSRILRLMTAGAVKNADAYKALGVRVFDASGNINNLGDIIGDLENAFEGMSDAERIAAMESLGFQARVQGIILPLLGTSDAIHNYEAGLRDAGGITNEVARKQLQTFNAQMTLMWHRIQDVFIIVGGKLVPGLTSFLQLLMEKLIPAVNQFIKLNLKEVLTALGVVGAIAGTAIAVAWAPVVAGFLVAAAPVVAVGAAIAAVAVGAAYLEKKTGFFSKKLLPALKQLGRKALPELKEFGQVAFKMAKDIAKFLEPSLDTLADLWSNVLGPAIREVAKLLKVTVLPVLKAVGKFLLDHKPLLIAVAAAILLLVAPWLAVVAAIAVVLAKWDEISAFFIGIKNTVVNTFNGMPGPVKTALTFIFNFTKAKIEGVIQVFKSMYTIIDGIVKLVTALVHGRWGQAWAALKQIAVGALNLLLGSIKALLGNIPSIIIGLLGQVAAAAGRLGRALGSGIANAVKGGINSMISFFERGLNSIIRKWNKLEFKVPSVNLGPLGKIGGGTVGVPDIPLVSIPRLQRGAFEILNNTLAQLHKGEMVVPQPFAEALRSSLRSPVAATAGGGSGATFNFYGGIQLSGKATREDAAALIDMVEAEWRDRRRRGR